MKILQFCWLVAILIGLNACGNSGASEDTKEPSKKEAKSGVSIETLDNFDNTYLGKVNDQDIQMNIRRYGSELSGNYWLKGDNHHDQMLKGVLHEGDFTIELLDKDGKTQTKLIGKLTDPQQLKGKTTDANGNNEKEFTLTKFDDSVVLKLALEPIEVKNESSDKSRSILISYPQLSGITDMQVAQKVNTWIEDYFYHSTKIKEVEDAKQNFKEDVKYDITYFSNEVISICKQHHLAKNNDTQMFDDSHGININFKRGKMYEIQDLFKPNALAELNKLIIERISKACGNTLDEATLEKCKVKPSETTSFSLGKDKMTFHLTERLPYKMRGCGYIRVEYKDLKEIMNPSGPIPGILKHLK
ncbi:MAG: hypothetical protein MUE85_16620 [Microscillaceae bacterium]|jgi:hypothetical protein|nr:hypothetical protein [Microscillaceae bacterium]